MRKLLILLSFLILASCSGKKPAKATFEFSVNQMAVAASGGLVIFGKSVEGAKFTRVVTSESLVVDIPMGTWTFGSIAWDGASNFKGNILCGLTTKVISGESAAVSLPMTNATCFTAVFADETGTGATPNVAKTLQPHFCENDVSSNTTGCFYDPGAPVSPPRSFVGSYKFSIRGGSTFGGGDGEKLETGCYQTGTDVEVSGGTPVSDLNIPKFKTGLGVPLHIEAFLGENCEATKKSFLLSFDLPSDAKFESSGSFTKFSLARVPLAQICVKAADVVGAFASGRGRADFPYVICNRHQLKHLHDVYTQNIDGVAAPTFAQGHYILGRDINLLGFAKGGPAPFSSCSDLGDTFVPFGKTFTACALGDTVSFAGEFDGNNFAISHFRFKDSVSMKIGLFSLIDGGKIFNLRLRKASVEGGLYVGAIAGETQNASWLSNVSVEDSFVKGAAYVGGVFGSSGNTNGIYDKIIAKRMSIEGTGTYVGGIVGLIGSHLYRTSFDGEIYTESGAYNIGGIAGQAGGNIVEAVSSGQLKAHGPAAGGSILGGIVGNIGGSVSYARSDLYIKDYNPSTSEERRIGGIVGTSSGAISRTFFMGTIDTQCTGTGCKIGGLIGVGGSSSDSYTLNQMTGLGGSAPGTLETLANIFATDTIRQNLCNGLSAAACMWKKFDKDLPRLEFEESLCMSEASNDEDFSDQSGKGTATDPYIVCNPSQILGLHNRPGFYRLGQNINGSTLPAAAINLSGNLDGAGYMIHSYYNFSSSPAALFGFINSGAVARNLKLVGFKLIGTTCSNCSRAPLALQNNGTVSRVEVSNAQVTGSDLSNLNGGLVSVNYGTISRSKAHGFVGASAYAGGIAADNGGTIDECESDVEISGAPYYGLTKTGGIAGRNIWKISRSSFSGEIRDVNNTDDDEGGIGGVAGVTHKLLTSEPRIENSHVSREALIQTAGTSLNTAGVVGLSRTGTTTQILNTIFEGFILNLIPDPEIGGTTSQGSFSEVNNINFTSPYTNPQAITTVDALTAGPDLCLITVDPATAAGNFGAVKFDNEAYMGTAVQNSTAVELTVPLSGSECTSYDNYTGATEFYDAQYDPFIFTANDLANFVPPFDLVEMDVDPSRAVAAYLYELTNGMPQETRPVWLFEEQKYKLFNEVD